MLTNKYTGSLSHYRRLLKLYCSVCRHIRPAHANHHCHYRIILWLYNRVQIISMSDWSNPASQALTYFNCLVNPSRWFIIKEGGRRPAAISDQILRTIQCIALQCCCCNVDIYLSLRWNSDDCAKKENYIMWHPHSHHNDVTFQIYTQWPTDWRVEGY